MIRHIYRDPRYLVLTITLIVVSGMAGFVTRPKLEDPKSQVRWGYVTTHHPGASPAEVESQITEPVEKVLREAKAIRSIESSSLRGVSIVFVRLTDELDDVSASWSKIQDKLSEVSDRLPPRATVPILVNERRWEAFTTVIALVDVSDHALPPAILARWAEELDNRLRFVPGTRFTEVSGIPEEEILVEVSAETISATGLAPKNIADRIQERDSQVPAGTSQSEAFHMPVQLAGDVDDLDRLRNVVLETTDEGSPLRLGDVARIQRREKRPIPTSAFVDGSRAVIISTRMDADYIVDTWTQQHMTAVEEFRKTLPAGLALRVLFSQKKYTDARSARLYTSLGLGMVFVVAVVWWMMGWRAAVPICSALPLSLLGVLALMIPFGVSLHQMSIAGLILALGLLIDNPIIVTDDIQRRLTAGLPPEEAVAAAVKHLWTPLLGANLTTILGFSPILLIPGPTGEYLGQFGWSVIASLFVSSALSLTVVPVIAGCCLGASGNSVPAETTRSSRYTHFLSRVFQRPRLTIGLSLLAPLLGFAVSGSLEEQFFPPAERDHFHFSVRLPANCTSRFTQSVAEKACEVIKRHKEVDSITHTVGSNAMRIHYSMMANDEQHPEYAQGVVQLNVGRVDPKLVRRIQTELDEAFPEAQSIVRIIEQGPPSLAPIEFRIYGDSLDRLSLLGEEARRIMLGVPGITHTRASLDAGAPEMALHLRQHDARSVSLSDEVLATQVRDHLDGVSLTQMNEEMHEVPIRVRIKDGHEIDAGQMLSLPFLPSPNGPVVPLASVAEWSVESRPLNIPRRNSSRCNTVYGYVAAGELPIVLERRFRALLEESGFALPVGYRADFGGVSAERDSALGNLLAYASVIGVLMIGVLVLTFRSFRQAGIILVVGVLSVGLGLLSLWMFGFPLGIVSIIGLLGIMGLAINDSIVVLTDTKDSLRQNEALATSVSHSTRHVLTTSLTTVAGVSPLILAGGDFWPPMMIVIAGGVVGATLLALGFTPASLQLVMGVRQPM